MISLLKEMQLETQVTTSISDHLTQYLIIRDKAINFEANRDSFLADLNKIDWDNYLKIYNSNTDLSFELFLRKINFLAI